MILTILEPAFNDTSNDLSHYAKNFAQWARGAKMGFWRLVDFPKSASSKSFQILNLGKTKSSDRIEAKKP